MLIQNNNEQKAVLASMAEGVLAVDSQERDHQHEHGLAPLLGLDQSHAQGRRLQEVVRNADLSRFVTRALASHEPIEADVVLHRRPPARDAGPRLGAARSPTAGRSAR